MNISDNKLLSLSYFSYATDMDAYSSIQMPNNE